MMDAHVSRTMEVPALGRPFSLGMLYDCRQDKFIPGLTLWDHDVLVKHIGERPQHYNGFEIVASESIEDKYSALNVEGSLKASLLFGLIEVHGSAKYLKDEKTSKHQARVTLKYEAATKFQELSMDHLGKSNVKYPEVYEKGLATHVVTGILYGAQAFFVFDREVSNHESHQHVEGSLKKIVTKIVSSAEGKGSLNMEDKDIKNVNNFSCKFHGDFLLNKTPASFQDTVEVYQSLPKLLGANGENAVPTKVWLMPLTSLDSSAAKVEHEISSGLIKEVQTVLEDLKEVEMRCNDVLTTSEQQLPQIEKNLKTFKELCSGSRLKLQQNLAKKLPSIREGREKEAELAEDLKKRHSSPFNSKNLNEWMDCKEREIYNFKSLTNMMKNTKIVSSQNHLHKEVLSAEHTVCFIFTSLGSEEPYLSALADYLQENRKQETTKPENKDPPSDVEKKQWYTTKQVTDELGNKAKLFSDFAEANKENKNIKFLTVGSTDETQKGSSICVYKDGFSVNDNFEPPSKPETVTVSDIKHNSVTLKISPPRFGAENITSYSVEFCVSGEDGWQQKKTASKAEEVTVTVSDLRPNTEFKFRCRAVTSVGVGPANEVSIQTSPCSSPEESNCSGKSRLADVINEKNKPLPQTRPHPVNDGPPKKEKNKVPGEDPMKHNQGKKDMDPEANRNIEMAALGRPFSLGMLYDCRQDALIHGITPWDVNDLEKDTRKTQNLKSDFEVVASESIEDKTSALNVEASLKASFLGGLVQVDGSAKYLNDSKTSKHQARVTLKYKATTKVQELTMSHLGNVKHLNVFDKGLATHVVTAVLYGAQAFFVFDREVTEQEDHQDIEGNMKMMIKKIPFLKIKGEGSLKMEDKERANVEKFSCKFYGDFCLQKTPASFQDAIQVYQSLPQLLGANGENAVPIKVWLLPLTSLDSSATKLVRQISLRLIKDSQSVLEDFSELEMRCNDAMKTTTAQQFPQICKKLKTFKETCAKFKREFQQNLAKKLPSIRGGGEEESVLAEILKKRHSSPFNSKDLNKWMDGKNREIYTLKSFANMMKNTKIVPSETQLYKETVSAEHTVCFIFTSLGSEEPYLSALADYLQESKPDGHQGIKTITTTASSLPTGEKEQWYASKEVADAMRCKAKLFSDFAEANKENKNIKFLTVGLINETQKGSSICVYKDGFSVNDNFEPPSKPETVTLSDINHNSVTLKISPPRFGAENITSYSVEFCVSGEDGWQQKTASKAEEVTVTVSDLRPNTEFKFRCRAVTSVGVGPANEISIQTSPCKSWLADVIKEKSKLLPQTGPLPVYQVPLKEEELSVSGCNSFSFGEDSMKHNRTIMVLGATGAGKSTLINGMINYILGVEWEDSYRFKLVDEGQARSQAESQTSEVTVYKINHQDGFKIDHSLTIVDTPGFGDARGIERDHEITEQIHNLFSAEHGVNEIDAVCFVVQCALARLTPTQKYVFDSVLSIFGKDVKENIRVLVTFADVQRPPVLEAIKASDVLCPKTGDGLPVHFKFNNSVLFANNKSSAADSGSEDDEHEGFDKMFWNMGTKNMKKFFAALNVIETKSLTLTKEVLRERKQLENSVENLQKQVKLGLAKLEEIRETSENLKVIRWFFPIQLPIDKLKAEYKNVQTEVEKLIEKSAKCLKRLKEIALKPNPLTTPDYIDMLIGRALSVDEQGWIQVWSLMDMREKAEIMAKVDQGDEFLPKSL